MRRVAALIVGTLITLAVFSAPASADPDPSGSGLFGSRLIDPRVGDTNMVMHG
ncbi:MULTISPECIES: hypothetical protein [Streptomyces]|uniref:Uncharacterized protein n=1 Tax=Streptomyces yunnanensis TaxID=156453 RepID=A0A9X8MJH0_9ACTN|nr:MULTISPECIES: hypothetical protein [Streptomyces]SHK81905.1 hypothetical protein SAMN05216268_101418 [Streptomyces yunnanensis]